jgi:hypothetical protein
MVDQSLASPAALVQPSAKSSSQQVTLADYAFVSVLLVGFIAGLAMIRSWVTGPELQPERLLAPMFVCVALTALVWLAMVVIRNWATLRGMVDSQYFLTYASNQPPEWIERPARTFNNLMQIPSLFYVVCLAMMVTHAVDRTQLAYAWTFVGLRVVHAAVYMGWNYLPLRFITWIMGSVTLGVLWIRFALQAWPGW